MISSLSFQSCQDATAPTSKTSKNAKPTSSLQKSQEINLTDLDLLARQLAVVFKKKTLRKILKYDVLNANTREHIIDAKTFLEKKINVQGYESSFKNILLSQVNKSNKNNLYHIFNILKKGKIDIYFPVHTHLEHFDVNKNDLRIGYINPRKEWDPVNVYSIDGQHELLDAHKPPNIPVLMINYCEHFGNHTVAYNHNIVLGQTIEGGGDGGGGGSSGGGSGGSSGNGIRDNGEKEYLDKAKQTVCEEPWGSGDPEIMYEIKNANGVIVHTQAFKKTDGNSYFDCTYTWYGELFHDYNWKTPTNFPSVYTWEQGVTAYTWHWWEDDGSVDWDPVYSEEQGDDDMGVTTVYRSNSQSTKYQTSEIEFYVRWNDN